MNEITKDLTKAFVAAIHDRREYARRLAGINPDVQQLRDDLIRAHQSVIAITAALEFETAR